MVHPQDQGQVENDRRRHDDGNGQTNAGERGANRRIHAALQAVRPRSPTGGPCLGQQHQRGDDDERDQPCTSLFGVIVAPCRYGGLRCPSEVLTLAWTGVDWEKDRFRVHAPKTEHHKDASERWVPIFPELRPYLQEALELASDGAV